MKTNIRVTRKQDENYTDTSILEQDLKIYLGEMNLKRNIHNTKRDKNKV